VKTDAQGLAREEAHHRFFNTLTTLSLLLRRDFAEFQDPLVRDAVATFEAQILAFAGVQRTLQFSAVAEVLDVPAHFGRLCAQLAAVQLAPRGFECEFFADEGTMDAGVGEKLGLIVVELITNAAKHAFRGRTWGRVSIALRRSEGGWTCTVRDNGVGLGARSSGTGLRLVEALATDIDARVISDSCTDGTQVIVLAPHSDFGAGHAGAL
jgi:two-component sensor histidine kinase